MGMFCGACAQENPAENNFCSACGKPLHPAMERPHQNGRYSVILPSTPLDEFERFRVIKQLAAVMERPESEAKALVENAPSILASTDGLEVAESLQKRLSELTVETLIRPAGQEQLERLRASARKQHRSGEPAQRADGSPRVAEDGAIAAPTLLRWGDTQEQMAALGLGVLICGGLLSFKWVWLFGALGILLTIAFVLFACGAGYLWGRQHTRLPLAAGTMLGILKVVLAVPLLVAGMMNIATWLMVVSDKETTVGQIILGTVMFVPQLLWAILLIAGALALCGAGRYVCRSFNRGR